MRLTRSRCLPEKAPLGTSPGVESPGALRITSVRHYPNRPPTKLETAETAAPTWLTTGMLVAAAMEPTAVMTPVTFLVVLAFGSRSVETAFAVSAAAVLLGVLFPTFGVSVLLLVAVDWLIARRTETPITPTEGSVDETLDLAERL